MQIIDQIRKEIAKRGLSVLKLSNETGISAYKIYKWLDGKGSPKHEDSKKLEQWLRSDVEDVPTGNSDTGNNTIVDAIEAVSTKDETIARLARLLEKQNKDLDALKETVARIGATVNEYYDLLRALGSVTDPEKMREPSRRVGDGKRKQSNDR